MPVHFFTSPQIALSSVRRRKTTLTVCGVAAREKIPRKTCPKRSRKVRSDGALGAAALKF
ncbi:MAG: hypothetical protein LBH84_05450 [Prevotellaceae bacterium]|nr:hypothetical protein [Prevotellaceae bacterium]